MSSFFTFDKRVQHAAAQAERLCGPYFARIEDTYEYNQGKVLDAFRKGRVAESHFVPSTGYGYSDRGREVLDEVFAAALGAECALVRHNFVSGTHTLATALFGVLRPGDTMVSVTGLPYDTIHSVIGLRGEGQGSLKDFGIHYRQVDLDAQGRPDLAAIAEGVKGAKMAYIQRSRGYSLRPSLSVEDIRAIVRTVKAVDEQILVFVDNCYGEFVEKTEPLSVGADLMAGSLIKNPGGGIAETGGYIAGRKDLVELCAYRLTCPGIGAEVGCTLGHTKSMFMGLFAAPRVTASAVKLSVFGSAFFSLLGYDTLPDYREPRADIITTVTLGSEQGMLAFCRGIQSGSPIDSFVTPEGWDMPGYDDPVVMAAGAFVSGSSIELSADGPIKPPYSVYMQGGLDYYSGKAGMMMAAENLLQLK